MDTSPEYILQCEKAEKIQKDWYSHPSTDRDFIWCKVHQSCWLVTASGYLCRAYEPCTVTGIWLPRQDDLQKMMGGWVEDDNGFVQLLHDFDQFVEFLGVPSYYHSMEQLWLAFVMFERYQKKWDGIEWIKIT